jgi:hypothetical protein
MGKPALGKGLGELMSGQRAPVRKPSPAALPPADKVTPVDFGRGLNTLVTASAKEKPEPVPPRVLLPPWFFFAADALLLAYTVAICLDAGDTMQTGEIFFAASSVSLGALLGIMGVMRSAPERAR